MNGISAKTGTDVIVVGAGIAGLTAAVCLQDAGLRVLILEGATQIGGRVQYVPGDGPSDVWGDLGPTWVWPRWQPVVAQWMERLALVPFAQHEDGDAILDGFGGPPRRQRLAGQDGIVRLVDGPTAIVRALHARLDPDHIITLAQVRVIETAGHNLRVSTADNTVFQAPQVILAAPLRLAAEQITIDGLPQALRDHMRDTPTWMAQQAKVVALYPTPFWRDAGFSGRVASRDGPLVEIHDHTPAWGKIGALFGFVGWDAAARQADPDGLRQAIIAQLVRCFGPQAATPLQITVKDWAVDPLICSAADLAGPPKHPEITPDMMREGQLGQRLWLAASETADRSPGLIEGALVAGETTAMRVRGQLGI
ncbi:FAD-dependent oxidoreductase [Yoonia sp.]|uniref:flavin monoamine oxidase family protein n=1 Tax=Yoonia sp. TaxID=2212373 RepID=UPI0025CCD601|nr:FAD-dependent oxidoreductase [Yoonia sp.]